MATGLETLCGRRVRCRGLTKIFGAVRAVDDMSLDVDPGEIVALLGPSGCGKTTFLRLIAGFERPDAGSVLLADEEVAGPGRFLPPERRRIGMVFQDYALFPHLSVADNVAFGLARRRRLSARGAHRDAAESVGRLLALVGLEGLGARLPHEISGGQQQRVALARALAPAPAVVLLDEPFSNLDATLRAEVRAEVRGILREAGATAVFVTHDQEEALSLADRVAVMRAGHLCQVDTPARLYREPADRFVATFVGDADLLPGHWDGQRVATAVGALRSSLIGPPGAVEAVIRPEALRLQLDGAGPAVVRRSTFFGHDQLVEVELGDRTVVRSRTGPDRLFAPGDRVSVAVLGDVVAFSVHAPEPAATPAELAERTEALAG
ncbi:MAG TPA: ABC transporter ATP-binding protein [Acidimicrobiia bacterium]|nr:ABC transporter ATP-binding protein [Acidimicrobiia bacterium]